MRKQRISQSNRLKKSPYIFRRVTGIRVEKFDEIIKKLDTVYTQRKKKNSKAQKRKQGGGPKNILSLEDQLLLTLMYYRTYSSHAFLGFLFRIDESTVGRNIKPIELCLASVFRIPERNIELSQDEVITLFFDGTEQQTQRPKSRQKKWYSGKKKRHTVKHQVVVARKKKKGKQKQRLRIAAVSKTFAGKTHDKNMYDKSRMYIPPQCRGSGDTAYRGTSLCIPYVKPKGGELTKKQKKSNKKHSSKRIVVEHGIGKMKIWQILSQRFRNKRSNHALVFKNVAGLHNVMFA